MCRFSKLLLFSFFFCKDGSDRLMKRASYSCCNFLCILLAAAYLKYRLCRLSCLPFVWHPFFIVTHTHTHTHIHTNTHVHARTHKRAHACTYACMHKRTHSRTHAETERDTLFELCKICVALILFLQKKLARLLWSTNTLHPVSPAFSVFCQGLVNNCRSGSCDASHGRCVDFINSSACLCTPGYSGDMCSIKTNECSSNPCQHGARYGSSLRRVIKVNREFLSIFRIYCVVSTVCYTNHVCRISCLVVYHIWPERVKLAMAFVSGQRVLTVQYRVSNFCSKQFLNLPCHWPSWPFKSSLG